MDTESLIKDTVEKHNEISMLEVKATKALIASMPKKREPVLSPALIRIKRRKFFPKHFDKNHLKERGQWRNRHRFKRWEECRAKD